MKVLVVLTIAFVSSLAGISLSIFKGQQAKGQESQASKLARLKDQKPPLEERIATAKEIGVDEIRLELPIGEYEDVKGDNELLVPIVGGKLVIDGVTVNQSSRMTEYFSSETETEQIPHPTALHHRIAGNKTYLLFIKPQPSRQFATLRYGSAGVFEVNSDDNLVPSVNRNNSHPLVRGIVELGAEGKELSTHNQKSKLELFRALVQQRNGR